MLILIVANLWASYLLWALDVVYVATAWNGQYGAKERDILSSTVWTRSLNKIPSLVKIAPYAISRCKLAKIGDKELYLQDQRVSNNCICKGKS